MKFLTVPFVLLLCVTTSLSQERVEEARFIELLHTLQYVETSSDLAKLIPNCPAPSADAGDDNTEILIRTKLFGFDAEGEFNFHKDVLVSHGFRILTPDYQSAHQTYLDAVKILDSQVAGLKKSVHFPGTFDGSDPSDGPSDELLIAVIGKEKDAFYQMGLSMRKRSIVVTWGAQKIRK